MLLSASTKSSLAEVLGLVQKTVLNAASELEDEAQAQIARIRAEAHEARRERDDALKSLHENELATSKYETELSQLRATIDGLQREVVHWKEQAKNWQEHYTRVEQDRCGLSTELLTLSRNALTESPPKLRHEFISNPNSAPASITKRASTSSNQPPSYKSAIPPSPSDSDSPLQQSISTQSHHKTVPRTPAARPAKQPTSARNEVPPSYHTAEASSSSAVHNQSARSAKTKASALQTPSQPPRQIFVRRVQAVVHVKAEEDDDNPLGDEEEEASEVPDVPDIRLVKRRRSGLMVEDEDDRSHYNSGSEQDNVDGDEESGDELMMNPGQEVYGGIHVHSVHPASSSTSRLKRPAANGHAQHQAAEQATPTKRRRVSDTATSRGGKPVVRKR
ncbi:hypothetical protein R3P38DRAFT_3387898 [Favolaschia claudopus]|uniref:Uncharacterized protein n=1 Tax=Favolaschia claudopus TaxID=2862362 RepID=A0AAW0DB93_9AGAR